MLSYDQDVAAPAGAGDSGHGRPSKTGSTRQVADDARLSERLERAEAELRIYRAGFAHLRATCDQASGGNLEPRCPHLGDDPELKAARRSLNHLLDLTDAFVREAGASLIHASAGKFYRRVLTRGLHGSFREGATTINRATDAMAAASAQVAKARADRLRLAEDFEAAVKSAATQVVDAAGQMQATASALASSAGKTAEQTAIVAAASKRASESVTSIASATEQLSSTMSEIDRQLVVSNRATDGAVSQSTNAGETVRGLERASREISEVITVIGHVANQTRLLALNATIEAARAGEAGKGFAVVASEVKNLAGQTAEATETVTRQISAVQTLSDQSKNAIKSIADAVSSVGVIAATITHSVSEQRLATGEISRSVQDSATSARDVSASIQAVRESTQATSESAARMESAAADLSALGKRLSGQVDHFLAEIRG
ncbi:MAG: methyl-accepting chemotaxis protein [Myxococcales bacterium]|nr:methyl-accepting chemotaxis protein [Myxococcales bacterium]